MPNYVELRMGGGNLTMVIVPSRLSLSKLEMHENPAKVFIVLLDPLIEPFDIRLGQEPENPLLQLAGTLAGDYFYQIYLFVCRFIYYAV